MDSMVAPFPVEFFAAKGAYGVVMSVPVRCGLRQADMLRVSGRTMIAMKDRSVLPIDLPELNEQGCELLAGVVARNKLLPVGEFSALGLVDSYFLQVVVAEA